VKLLYVTPEKLVGGGSLKSALDKLAAAGLLARFVIDEVRGDHVQGSTALYNTNSSQHTQGEAFQCRMAPHLEYAAVYNNMGQCAI
jgi:hypothetical protein